MTSRLKACAIKLDILPYAEVCGLSRNTSTDSIVSIIFPWRLVHQRPPVVTFNQAGREVRPAGFYLCMGSVMLLSTAIGICAAALWATISRKPYTYLTADSILLATNIFSLCAGLLAIPCFWIAWTSHDCTKNYRFLPLLIALLGFSLIMLSISTTMGLVYKSRIHFNMTAKPPRLITSQYEKLLNETMFMAMSYYEYNDNYRYTWDTVQFRLKCCGTTSFKNWIDLNMTIPLSCCLASTCHDGGMYTRGCIDLVAFDILWQTGLISGLSLIVFCIQLFTLFVASYMYVKGRLHNYDSPVRLQLSNNDNR